MWCMSGGGGLYLRCGSVGWLWHLREPILVVFLSLVGGFEVEGFGLRVQRVGL